MVDFKKKLEDMKSGKPPKPFQHPKLEEDFYRLFFKDVRASTAKATLYILEDDQRVWIPNSQHKMRYGKENAGVTDADKRDCIDVTAWFYESEINNKNRK